MLIQKHQGHLPCNPIRTYKTIFIWCADGWRYDTCTRIRQRFEVAGIYLKVTSEPYAAKSYSAVKHTENADVLILSDNPLSWVEKGEGYNDVFSCVSNDVLEVK